jgi:hypothetical protein
VADVHARIAKQGSPDGAFSGWAEEELKVSRQTAGQWAEIGYRYDELANALARLPDSWGTWYELAKADDKVFRIALRRVRAVLFQNSRSFFRSSATLTVREALVARSR